MSSQGFVKCKLNSKDNDQVLRISSIELVENVLRVDDNICNIFRAKNDKKMQQSALHILAEIKKDECTLFDPTTSKEARTIPFSPMWVSGVNVNTIINLTLKKSEIKIVYSAAHIGIIYDHKYRKMRFLMGHSGYITSMSVSDNGRWIASADNESESSVIVWQSEECIPVRTIFNAHNNCGVCKVKLSPDAKYLITVGSEPMPIVKFWMWTLGKEEAEASYEVQNNYGDTKVISVNPNKCEHFAVTFAEAVIFLAWENFALHDVVNEVGPKKSKYGTYVDTTFMERSHECLTVTTNGWVIVWGNTFHSIDFDSVPITNDKFFIKAIRLQKNAITSIRFVDGIICTTDDKGILKYYDDKLTILYSYPKPQLPFVQSIFFNKRERKYSFKDPTVLDSAESSIKNFSLDGLDDEDRSETIEELYSSLLPSDFTLQQSPFLIRDFMIVTLQGELLYVDATTGESHSFFATNYSQATSIDVHGEKPIICIGYANGLLNTFNYETFQFLIRQQIMNSKDKNFNIITCIRYSAQGLFMACGTGGGHIWFLDPTTLQPYMRKPFIYDHSKIVDIQFSEDCLYLAYCDSSLAVCLMKRSNENSENVEWVFNGRYIAHTAPITGLLFINEFRLFSIAMDKYIVEYNVKESEPGKLEILTRICVMQRGYPLGFLYYNIEDDIDTTYFLLTTSEYKYLIINERTDALERTILAPCLGYPVNNLKIIPSKRKRFMMYQTGKYLGIQMLPVSSNPYRYANLIAHAKSVAKFCISNCGNYVFTLGEDDNICIMWYIRLEAVEYLSTKGGRELVPYYPLIEGGVEGWLFQEIKDLFYYMQILHQGEDSPFPRVVSDKIPVTELPNLMRAIGYFPTEYELENILYEVKNYFVAPESKQDEITFENFMKLYINHRPVKRFTRYEIQWAFSVLGINGNISKNKFIELMCNKGEPFQYVALKYCMVILLNQNRQNLDENVSWETLMPEDLNYINFMDDILGVDERFL